MHQKTTTSSPGPIEPDTRKPGPSIVTMLVILAAGPLLLMAALLVFFWTVDIQPRYQVFLANGLGEPYQVRVNGELYNLDPGVTGPLEELSPPFDIQPIDEALPVATGIFNAARLQGLSWLRPVTLVVNPDTVAVIRDYQMVYSYDPNPSGGTSRHVFGQTVHQFPSVHYPFTSPPEYLNEPFKRSDSYRRCLEVATTDFPSSILFQIALEGRSGEAIAFARRLLEVRPHDEEACSFIAWWSDDEEEVRQLVMPLLDVRPVRIALHELCHEMAQYYEWDFDFTTHYAGAIAAEPENGDLIYLASLFEEDPASRRRLLLDAARAPTPSASACLRIARQLLARGSYDYARDYIDKARDQLVDRDEFNDVERRLALAHNRPNDAMSAAREVLRKDKYLDIAPYADLAVWFASLGRGDLVDALVTEVFDAYVREYNREIAHFNRQVLRAKALYGEGKTNEYFEALAAISGYEDDARCERAIHEGDYRRAWRVAEPTEGISFHHTIAIHILALQAGDAPMVSDTLKDLIEWAELEDVGGEAMAAMLSRTDPPTREEMLDLEAFPAEKRLVLLVVGLRFPEIRNDAFELARLLNRSPAFPGHLVERITTAGR